MQGATQTDDYLDPDYDPYAGMVSPYPEVATAASSADPMAADETAARQWMENFVKNQSSGGVSLPGAPDYDKAMKLYRAARAAGQDHQAALSSLGQYGSSDPNFWLYPSTQAATAAPPAATSTGSADTYGSVNRVNRMVDNIPDNFYEAPSPFQYPDFVPPEFNAPEFHAPDRFQYPEFALPSGDEVLRADPGYDFRKREGLRTQVNRASADGILRGGAAQKGMIDWTEGLASQEYGQAAGRSFNTWQANRGAAAEDYDRLWKNLLTTYALDYDKEANKFDRAKSIYGTNFGTAATGKGFDIDIAAGKAGGRQGATSLAGNLALGAGSLGLNQDDSRFKNILSLYDISTRNLPTYQPTAPNYGYTGA